MPVDQMNKTVKILVVDDQPGMRLTLKAILSKKGYEVFVAEDGERAVEMVKESAFNVIFMDIKMPRMSGVQAYSIIKDISPQSTVIMMTAFALEDEINKVIREGAYAVIHKPVDIEWILSVVAERLERKAQILLVDDQFEDREFLKLTLEKNGYRVVTAQNSAECIRAVTEKKYQVVLMDCTIPGTDGVQTMAQVKQIRPDVEVILMSAFPSQDLAKNAIARGSFAFVNKPLKIDQLLATIQECLKSKNP